MAGQWIDKIEQYTSAGFESIWQERENVFFLIKSHRGRLDSVQLF